VIVKKWRSANIEGKYLTNEELENVVNVVTNGRDELPNATLLWELQLSLNFLRYLPEGLFKLSGLQRLFVRNNLLTQVPNDINRLVALRYLDLSGNFIVDLPIGMFELPCINTLRLHTNLITSLPSQIGNLTTLKILQLDHNRLNSLPDSLCKIVDLWELIAHDNLLTDVPSQLGKLKSLKKLNLQNNFLQFLPRSVAAMSQEVVVAANNPYWRTNNTVESGKVIGNLIPSLKEIAARKIIRSRISYVTLPKEMQEYILSPSQCDHCLGPYFEAFVTCNLQLSTAMTVRMRTCSVDCAVKLCNNSSFSSGEVVQHSFEW